MKVARMVLGLGPDAESVRTAMGNVFATLKDEVDEPGRREALEAFHREVVRMVINWMARSDEDSLRAVHGVILAQLSALGGDHLANRYLADDEWLGMQLRGLAVVISSYLRTDNLARSLGQVSGHRRASWRRALAALLELQRPVRPGELQRQGVFSKVNTADNALKKLAELGLVERRGVGTAMTYTLTWWGEQVARFWERTGTAPPGSNVTEPEDELRPQPERGRARRLRATAYRAADPAADLAERLMTVTAPFQAEPADLELLEEALDGPDFHYVVEKTETGWEIDPIAFSKFCLRLGFVKGTLYRALRSYGRPRATPWRGRDED